MTDPVMFSQSIIAAILCRDYRNPITGSALAEQFSTNLRAIADVVRDARAAGIKIASSRGGYDEFMGVNVEPGYYQAFLPEQMAATSAMLRKTAMDLLHTAKVLMDFGGANPSLYEQSPPEEEAA